MTANGVTTHCSAPGDSPEPRDPWNFPRISHASSVPTQGSTSAGPKNSSSRPVRGSVRVTSSPAASVIQPRATSFIASGAEAPPSIAIVGAPCTAMARHGRRMCREAPASATGGWWVASGAADGAIDALGAGPASDGALDVRAQAQTHARAAQVTRERTPFTASTAASTRPGRYRRSRPPPRAPAWRAGARSRSGRAGRRGRRGTARAS